MNCHQEPQEGDRERWVPVLGWEDWYMVSSQGRVYSVRTGYLLNPSRGKYLQVGLQANGKHRRVGVHILVLEAFVGPRPPGHHAHHVNHIKFDNRLTNLCWVRPCDNIRAAFLAGRHWYTLTVAEVLEVRRRHAAGESQSSLAVRFGVSPTTIHNIVHRKTWKAV